jgi:hypothetical protein
MERLHIHLEEIYRLVHKANQYRYTAYVQGEGSVPQASNKPCTISERCALCTYNDFQHVPKCIADFVDDKQFVKPLRSLLIEQSFHSIDEFLDYSMTQM